MQETSIADRRNGTRALKSYIYILRVMRGDCRNMVALFQSWVSVGEVN